MKNTLLLIGLLVLAPLVGACASAAAKAPDRPPLTIPAPPPRIIEPAPELLTPEPVAELPLPNSQPGPSSPTRPGRAARDTPPKAESKPAEPKPGDPKPVDQPPIEPPAPLNPAAQLRTPQTADTSGAAKTVRATIDTAQGLLNSVNFGPLSNERKKAYNDVKLLLQQAEDGLKAGNLDFAASMAKKAETLAKELAGR
jgi:hypothetical protein